MEYEVANVFDLLPNAEPARAHHYDFIILDPPAFTKSGKTVNSARCGATRRSTTGP